MKRILITLVLLLVFAYLSVASMTGVRLEGVSINPFVYDIIGTPGLQGFGVGVCDPAILPANMTPLTGYKDKSSDNYGNYQYADGSIVVYIPRFYYKITAGTNDVDIKGIDTYANQAAANAASYALHRSFIDGGIEQRGFFVDKYMSSKNAWGTGYISSSLKSGNPISTASIHNPIADLTACDTNAYFETIDAAHARDGIDGAVNASSNWNVISKFQMGACAMLSLAHAQASSATTYCAWYDATYNYPKGCNNNALKDYDEVTNGAGTGDDLLYVSDGYSQSAKTGSGVPFAKSTHNGQNCGVADLNGLMYEINIGITNNGTNFYAANEATAMKDFTSGNSTATDHWGANGIAAMMSILTVPYVTGNDGWIYFGNSTNQVLSEDVSGNDRLLTGLGLPDSISGLSGAGTNQFGKDGLYRYICNELCVLSCTCWYKRTGAGLWAVALFDYRAYSSGYIGFRSCLYPE